MSFFVWNTNPLFHFYTFTPFLFWLPVCFLMLPSHVRNNFKTRRGGGASVRKHTEAHIQVAAGTTVGEMGVIVQIKYWYWYWYSVPARLTHSSVRQIGQEASECSFTNTHKPCISNSNSLGANGATVISWEGRMLWKDRPCAAIYRIKEYMSWPEHGRSR